MRTIFKYQLPLMERSSLMMPEGSVILSAQEQFGAITVWAEVETANPVRARLFYVINTGGSVTVPNNAKFIDTVQIGPYVWHVYADPE